MWSQENLGYGVSTSMMNMGVYHRDHGHHDHHDDCQDPHNHHEN